MNSVLAAKASPAGELSLVAPAAPSTAPAPAPRVPATVETVPAPRSTILRARTSRAGAAGHVRAADGRQAELACCPSRKQRRAAATSGRLTGSRGSRRR